MENNLIKLSAKFMFIFSVMTCIQSCSNHSSSTSNLFTQEYEYSGTASPVTSKSTIFNEM